MDNTCNKTRSTLFLSFCISITNGCICSHSHPLFYSFRENTSYNRLIHIIALFSFHNRSKDECFISLFCIKCFIRISYFFAKFLEHHSDHIISRSLWTNSIGIRIEKSFKTSYSSQKWKISLILSKIESRSIEKISNFPNSFTCEISINIIRIPPRKDSNGLISIEWF